MDGALGRQIGSQQMNREINLAHRSVELWRSFGDLEANRIVEFPFCCIRAYSIGQTEGYAGL